MTAANGTNAMPARIESIKNTGRGTRLRTCIGCGRARPKDELFRLVASPQLALDLTGRQQGRGAYLCGLGCLTAAVKRKAFHRAFRGKVLSVDLTSLELALAR